MKSKNIENIMSEYNLKVKSVIKSFLKTHNDIDDVSQEVYIKTWKNIDKFQNKGSLWGWMRQITVNTCKNHLKSKKHLSIVVNNEEEERKVINIQDKKLSTENKLEQTERQKIILTAINSLKPKLKEVVLLYDIEELTYEEISKKINKPVGTVKSRLYNARQTLKKSLEELLN